MVEKGRLSGDITHVHDSNIWDEQGEKSWEGLRWSLYLIILLAADNQYKLQQFRISTISFLHKVEVGNDLTRITSHEL